MCVSGGLEAVNRPTDSVYKVQQLENFTVSLERTLSDSGLAVSIV
jgi:hypothetical protein